MNLLFRKIKAKNFHSFEDLEFEFTPGRHLIIGEDLSTGSSNGSGKSSILESLVWTLYKKSVRGTDPSTNGRGNCVTTVEFEKDGKQYVVERSLKMGPQAKSSVKIYCNDEDISARQSVEVDAQIEKIVGIPYDLFISTCVVLQGIPINFTQFTPSLRKSVFESILGFSVWDDYKTRLDKKGKVLQSEIRALEQEYSDKETRMTDLNARIETLEKTNENLTKEIKQDIEQKRQEIKELGNTVTSKKDEIQKYLSEYVNEPDTVKGLLRTKESALYKAKSEIQNLEEIIKNTICPTCEREYEKSRIGEAQSKLETLIAPCKELEHQVNLYRKVDKAVSTLELELARKTSELKSKKAEFAGLMVKLDNASKGQPTEPLKAELSKILEEVNALNTQIKDLSKENDQVQWLSSLLLPSSEFRTRVLADYIASVTSIISTVSPCVFPGVDIKLVVNEKATGIDIEISRRGKFIEYKQLSGGEKRRLDVIIILSIQKFMLEASGVRTNLLSFDEIFDGLDHNGVENVLQAFDVVFDGVSSVYVISHNDSLKTRFDNVIVVSKDNGVSKVWHK